MGLHLELLEDRTLLDAAGPQLLSHTAEVHNGAFDAIDLQFSAAIAADSFTVDDVLITGPAGPSAASSVEVLGPDSFRVRFSPLATQAIYSVTIGPYIADLAGNWMDQNQNGTPGEPAADGYTAALAVLTSGLTVAESNATYDGTDLLVSAATAAIDGPHNFHSLALVNNAVLTHSGASTVQTHSLDLVVATQVTVDSTSRIDASGKGYVAGRTTGNTSTGGSTIRSGGSYGGVGGAESGVPNAVYGDYANPNDWGSGSSDTAAGGGLIRLAAGTLALDGQLLAQGQDGANGGSGGGIYVAVTTLQGQGSIQAAGGVGQGGGPFWGGGGGGGRVAVYAQGMAGFDASRITAPGGPGGPGGPDRVGGGAGTVYLRNPNEAQGTLIIDGARQGNGYTPLGFPGQTMTIPDAVVIRGNNTVVTIASSVTIQGATTISNGGVCHGQRSDLGRRDRQQRDAG